MSHDRAEGPSGTNSGGGVEGAGGAVDVGRLCPGNGRMGVGTPGRAGRMDPSRPSAPSAGGKDEGRPGSGSGGGGGSSGGSGAGVLCARPPPPRTRTELKRRPMASASRRTSPQSQTTRLLARPSPAPAPPPSHPCPAQHPPRTSYAPRLPTAGRGAGGVSPQTGPRGARGSVKAKDRPDETSDPSFTSRVAPRTSPALPGRNRLVEGTRSGDPQ